ncbi:MAG: hypothetical protein HeimC3_37040 [Candidatus Heimdallarchaeota archaeon LC_3]|nr:MAG: hypothetical protein HeimC3_37040 [Candidatus Heimdallarchaeota archaeon LC_3]
MLRINKLSKTDINTLKLISKYPNKYSAALARLKAQDKKESKTKGIEKYQANISRSIIKLGKNIC